MMKVIVKDELCQNFRREKIYTGNWYTEVSEEVQSCMNYFVFAYCIFMALSNKYLFQAKYGFDLISHMWYSNALEKAIIAFVLQERQRGFKTTNI